MDATTRPFLDGVVVVVGPAFNDLEGIALGAFVGRAALWIGALLAALGLLSVALFLARARWEPRRKAH